MRRCHRRTSTGSKCGSLEDHSRLKTKELLWQRHALHSPVCDICNMGVESTPHAVRDCRMPAAIWHQLLPEGQGSRFWEETDTKIWIRNNLNWQGGQDMTGWSWRDVFDQAVQTIWQYRNQTLFQQGRTPYFCMWLGIFWKRTQEVRNVFRNSQVS